MRRLDIHDAKIHLSRHLAKLEAGEVILLCERNVPIAEIRPLPRPRAGPRPIGFLRGASTVEPSFFEPLPEEELRTVEGHGE